MAFPLYTELHRRAQVDPIERPDWEQYWNLALSLAPAKLEVLLALVQMYRNTVQGLPADIIKPLPGGKGVTVNTERMPPLLQQIILHYLNQVE